MEIHKVGEQELPSLSSPLKVLVAVSGNKSSKYAVKWALEKFIAEGRVFLRLLHVCPKITAIPTPLGNVPISNAREDVAYAYRQEMDWQRNKMLHPYKKMCAQRQVQTEVIVVEADDIATAISVEIARHRIDKLVVGASSKNIFTRKFQGKILSLKIAGCVPSFCTVYVVSKGKLASVHASTASEVDSATDLNSSSVDSLSFSSESSSTGLECNFTDATTTLSQHTPLTRHPGQSLLASNSNFGDEGSLSCASTASEIPKSDTINSFNETFNFSHQPSICNQESTSEARADSSESQNQVDIPLELKRLRYELKNFQKVYEIAQIESANTSKQIRELAAQRVEEEIKVKEMHQREAIARELASKESKRREATEREAQLVKECAEREDLLRKNKKSYASNDADTKQKLKKGLAEHPPQYKEYTWNEIDSATSSFCDDLKIGKGANGTVYKGNFHHTVAAVKVLHSNATCRTKQFNRELEILGGIRHPHILLLLGACPEHGSLVFEFMENGSLEDRLQCKDDTAPLPWFIRYRITWEVATALIFLHSAEPSPIIHRDLKPANILLDRNFVSRVGDVGLSTLIPDLNFSMSTMMNDTTPAGTLCYIDPEYLRTGMLSPMSDIYALGIVILQLLTSKAPIGLADTVERAIQDGNLVDILDSKAGKWPLEETMELALLGVGCAEMRRKDRLNLKAQVLPMLEKLKLIAEKAQDRFVSIPAAPPNHFICPILQEVMDDPCVASDGYTYDRKAIEVWLGMNDKSPMTNLPLPDKNLITNYSLRSAILEWRSKIQITD